MTESDTQFVSADKKKELEAELLDLKLKKIPDLAKRVDEARQLGDLSENAEYHQAREDMAWAQSRIAQINKILDSSEVVGASHKGDVVTIGSSVIVESKGKKKEYTIVGAQEADPLSGKISNESPLGQAFLGKKQGDTVDVEIPAGKQTYVILEVK